MKTILKIIKINLLSIIALPLLLIATLSKLIAKALEKFILLFGMTLTIGVIMLLFELMRNPKNTLQGMILLVICLVIGGLLVAGILFVLSLISKVCMKVIDVVIKCFLVIYELVYGGYAQLFNRCKKDYEEIGVESKAIVNGSRCLFYTILRVVNKSIVFLVTHALKIFIVASVALVVGSLISLNMYFNGELGIGLFAYLGLFNAYEVVYGVVVYVAAVGSLVVWMISLGIEWNEWGREMNLATTDYAMYTNIVLEHGEAMENSHIETNGEKYEKHSYILDNHLQDYEGYLKEVGPLVQKSDDMVLKSNYGQYITTINQLVETISENSENGAIPEKVFEGMIESIDKLDNLKKNISKKTDKIKIHNIENQSSFFVGCNTNDKLEKRYKALCKTYHPDGDAGDEETFKLMKEEYENKRATLSI